MLGVPVKPTIKQVDSIGMVTKTLVRADLWEVQTPQVSLAWLSACNQKHLLYVYIACRGDHECVSSNVLSLHEQVCHQVAEGNGGRSVCLPFNVSLSMLVAFSKQQLCAAPKQEAVTRECALLDALLHTTCLALMAMGPGGYRLAN